MADDTKRTITLDWDDAGQLHLAVDGGVSADHMVMGAFYLTRLASQITDARLAEAMQAKAPAIIPVHGKIREARA